MEIAATESFLLRQTAGPETIERELVDKARSGDQEAFGELVRRHRARALGWAGNLIQDTYLAEDIVQEALIRAFLHLGTLSDTGRFVPWLHRIVKNQAYMKLRRGGPYGKERPFTSFEKNANSFHTPGKGEEAVDWSSIDSILFHLADSAAEEGRSSNNPEEYLMRQEMLQSIHLLINCLNKRERAIFEARFFGELPPAEIASLFNLTTANVYNALSRSRVKLQKERIRISITMYVQKRAEQGKPTRNILSPPPI